MRQIAKRSDIRDLILDAVDALLAKYGYGKMTVEDVAKQVGIGKGTIYLHFPSKEELVLAHIDRIAERVIRQLQELAGSSDSFDRRLRRMLVVRVLHRFDSVAHYSRNLGDLLSSVRAPLLQRRQTYFEKEAAVFEGVLREGARSGSLDCPDPRGPGRRLPGLSGVLRGGLPLRRPGPRHAPPRPRDPHHALAPAYVPRAPETDISSDLPGAGVGPHQFRRIGRP